MVVPIMLARMTRPRGFAGVGTTGVAMGVADMTCLSDGCLSDIERVNNTVSPTAPCGRFDGLGASTTADAAGTDAADAGHGGYRVGAWIPY
jgi:hypothetical protein